MAKRVSKPDPTAGVGAEPGTWREQAVARSLDSARTRAENRVQRFLDAAVELAERGDGSEFTVQEVVERSGQSLRSFYQYFGGKHELLLALFEESVRATADQLREQVATQDGALAQLRSFVVEYYRLCSPAPKRQGSKPSPHSPLPSVVLAEFAQQLLTAHPAEAARAFVPLVALFEELLQAAVDAGAVRAGLDSRRVSGAILEVIMFNAFSATIAGAPVDHRVDAAEGLWDVLLNGLGTGSTA